ncbi:hypothetical protein RJ639_010163 [Escallonia herrerae]|uniref:Retrotransposon gag domain-containing protein n=1 Tax=Escallonia herrerae TaxID=1293975 RepID=A0AA89AWV6_9ASTE|nr:hypothetical protein RJ639_010163 [Escallonia herrerae]
MGAPKFEGSTDLMDVKNWIQGIKKVFTRVGCLEAEKVTYATFMLEKNAYSWWLMEQQKHEENREPYTWEKLKEAFKEKYQPKSVRLQKKMDFIKLEHGNKSLAEYQMPHALGVVEAALELVRGKPIRYPYDHCLLHAVSRRGKPQRRVAIRRRRASWGRQRRVAGGMGGGGGG